jgi:putative oxidoreductase
VTGSELAALVLRASVGATMVAHGVGTMAVAARTVHVRNGFFITAEGFEYVLAVGAAATALAALGPGRWSVDRLLGRGQPAVATAALAAGLGLAGAAAHLALFWRPQPAERG